MTDFPIRKITDIDTGETCSTLARGSQDDGRGGNLARRRYQSGTLRLEGKRRKVWTLRWREDMILADGSTRRIGRKSVIGSTAEFPTQKLARRRADLILSRINRPDYRPGKVTTFAEFVERWKEHVLSQQKPSTRRGCISRLNLYLVKHFGNQYLDHIGQEDVQRFVSLLGSLSRSTVHNILAVLFSILKTARKWGYAVNEIRQADLALANFRPPRAGRFFTAEQIKAILGEASEPWRTIFAVAALTGMRSGELLGLTIEDLDFERKEIFVRRAAWKTQLLTPKTSKSVGRVPMQGPLEEILIAHLSRWAPNPRQLLFATSRGNPIPRGNIVDRKLHPILDKLGIPRCGMHAFRHGAATLMIASGATIKATQEQLRHSDPMTTLRMYVHSVGGEQRQAAEKFAEILRPNATNSNAKPLLVN